MIGKSVTKRPYTNYRLNNNVTNTGTGTETLTVSGATGTTGIFGESNGAYDFDGSNDKIYSGTDLYDNLASIINATDGFTAFWWQYVENTTNFYLSYWCTDSTSAGATTFGYLQVPTGDLQIATAGANQTLNSIYSQQTINLNVWESVAVKLKKNVTKYDGAIYKNGSKLSMVKSDTNQLITPSVNASRAFTLGARVTMGTASWFNGKINNFRVYNTTLSDGQIKIINNEKGRITV